MTKHTDLLGFEVIDIDNIIKEAACRQKSQELADSYSVEELVDEYEKGMTRDYEDRDDDYAMHKTMMDAPDLYEQKIRNKIRKEINKLLK